MKDRRISRDLVFIDCDAEFYSDDDCEYFVGPCPGECIHRSGNGDGMCYSQRRNAAALKQDIDALKAQLTLVRKFREQCEK